MNGRLVGMEIAEPGDYVTRIERFQIGDFPLVCVRSGRTDNVALRPAVAHARTLPGFWERWFGFRQRALHPQGIIPGSLPYAPGEPDVEATFAEESSIVIRSAHPNFVNATRARQGRR